MYRTCRFVLITGALLSMSAAALADSISWDILSENYGSGSGQVAFNDCYDKASSSWGVQADPAETLHNGSTTLTLAAGSGVYYPAKQTIAGMVTGNADFTMEYKVEATAKSLINLYVSETNAYSTASWNHLLQLNGTYAGYQADALQDYALRNGTNQAPAGFDGGTAHTYRFVRQSGVTSLYLDGNTTPAVTMINGTAGAAADGMNLEWGFAQNAAQSVDVNMYYLKIASGAHAPVPEPSAILLMLTGTVGLIAYAWRKRR